MIVLLIFILAIASAVITYNFLSGKNIILDYLHYFRIDSRSVQYWDNYCYSNQNKSGIIISLTTIPSRFAHIIPTIKSLLAQSRSPQEIIIYIPKYSVREQAAYLIPKELVNLNSLKVVEVSKDWGPATKFIPAILSQTKDQKILVVDDDNIYPSSMLKDFYDYSLKHVHCILTTSGWRVPIDLVDRPTTLWSNIKKTPPTPVTGRRVAGLYKTDIIQGYSGYLIKPKFFDGEEMCDYSGTPKAARFVDDVWVSRLCYSVFWNKKLYQGSSLAKINNCGKEDYSLRNNSIMIKHFEQKWNQSRSEVEQSTE
jgi:hypothetical protein